MNELQDRFITPPALFIPRKNRKYTIGTDSCDLQVGCIMLQEQSDGTKKPLVYSSRSSQKAEKAYDTTNPECLADL